MRRKIGITAAVVVFVVLIVGGFYLVTYREKNTVEDTVELTEVQNIITKNLDTNYPETPREVVKLYNRIICCYFNETYTDAELYELGDQARKLFDDELLENNPREVYFSSLKEEIEEYHDKSQKITSWNVSKSSEITFLTVDGRDCAYVESTYFVDGDETYNYANQTYVLRKDENGKWKILAYYKTEVDSSDE